MAEAGDAAPKPGEVFAGKYVVDRPLGAGGMGFVFAATHVHLREPVAIKMLLPRLAVNPDTVERFLREGRAAVKIKSEHVVRILDVAELPDRTPYMVMERLEGSDLQALLREARRLPYAQAVEYILQACEAVAMAHALKTVHRDLKPSNLFVARLADGTECVKVLDFGISKMAADVGDFTMTKTSDLLGSPLYMSPEQLRNSKLVDERADIWALGVILYELVAGKPPFMAQTLPELGALVLAGRAPSLAQAVPDAPPALVDAIAACLRTDPNDRLPNVAAFADAIAPLAGPSGLAHAERIRRSLGIATAQRGSLPAAAVQTAPQVAAPPPEVASAPAVFAVTPTGPGDMRRGPSLMPAQAMTRPSIPETTGRDRTSRAAVVVVSLLAGAALIVGVGFAGAKHFRAGSAMKEAASATTTPAPPSEPPPPQSAPPAPSVSVASTPSSAPPAASSTSASVHDLPAATARPATRPVVAAPPPPSPAVIAQPANAPAPAPRPTASSPPPNCTPPYVVDDQGKKTWKRECL